MQRYNKTNMESFHSTVSEPIQKAFLYLLTDLLVPFSINSRIFCAQSALFYPQKNLPKLSKRRYLHRWVGKFSKTFILNALSAIKRPPAVKESELNYSLEYHKPIKLYATSLDNF